MKFFVTRTTSSSSGAWWSFGTLVQSRNLRLDYEREIGKLKFLISYIDREAKFALKFTIRYAISF